MRLAALPCRLSVRRSIAEPLRYLFCVRGQIVSKYDEIGKQS
jgi:hypothetical protein